MSSAKGTESEIIDSTSDERQIVNFSPVTAREDRSAPISSDASSTQKIKEDYKEPWVTTFFLTPLSLICTHMRENALRVSLLQCRIMTLIIQLLFLGGSLTLVTQVCFQMHLKIHLCAGDVYN